MNIPTYFAENIRLYFGLVLITLTAMAVTFKPIAPSIEVLYGNGAITNNHASFEIENGTDWETFYGLAKDNDVLDEERIYTIANTGDAPLVIQNISLENLSDNYFSIEEQPANSTIAPGDSATFKIGYTIRGYGVSAAKITITTNAPTDPTYLVYLMANSIECALCPSSRNTGSKCKTCVSGYTGAPLCEDCVNPKHDGENCNRCKDKYNPQTFPACNECRSSYMVNDCTACVFPGQDINNYCNTCTDPTKRWPRCYI